jgi:hypothetical protein
MSLREIPGQLEVGEFGEYVVLSATVQLSLKSDDLDFVFSCSHTAEPDLMPAGLQED